MSEDDAASSEHVRSRAARRLRQLYEFLRWCGIEPDRSLTWEELKGIDLPDTVW